MASGAFHTDPPTPTGWLEHWTDARLRDRFGGRSLERARAYAEVGNVTELWSNGPGLLGALVQGTAREPYEVHVRNQVIRKPGMPLLAWLHCNCTCPVRTDCKHAVAAVISAREARTVGVELTDLPMAPGARRVESQAPPRTPPDRQEPSARGGRRATPPRPAPPVWEQVLSPVVASARQARQSTVERVPAALRFTRAEPGARRFGAGVPSPVPDIRVRPLMKGASGRWIKTGIDWENLEASRTSLSPAHYEALLALRRLRTPNRYAYQAVPEELPLGSLGERVWAVLAEAAAAGVEFVGDGVPAPRVLTEPAHVALVAVPDSGPLNTDDRNTGASDSTTSESAASDSTKSAASDSGAGGIALRLHATHAGLGLDSDLAVVRPDRSRHDVLAPDGGRQVWLVGTEAHGLASLSADELVFAPLERPLGATVGSLAVGPLPIRVPAADVPRFTADFLPALRREVTVEAAEGVELPEAVPPRLKVVARFSPEHRVALSTGVVYLSEAEVPADRYAFRDPAAEQALIDDFPAELAPPGLVVQVGGRRALAPAQAYTGAELIAVATRLLPELARRSQVRVTIEGNPPEYQETESEAIIEFRLDDHLGVTDGDTAGDGRHERTDWFNLGITVRVSTQVVTFVQLFTALAAGESRMMLPDGAWFSLDRPEFEQLRALIEESRHLLDPEKNSLRITPVHLGLWEHLVALGVVEKESAAWKEKVAALIDADTAPSPAPPSGLRASLRPYQVEGYAWMVRLWRAGLGGILADDMGLGKTVQVLALAAAAHEAGRLDEAPMLVVAPTSVVGTWVSEAAKFTPGLRVATLGVTTRKSKRSIEERILDEHGRRAHLVVTTYAIARIDEQQFAKHRWSAMFLDEAQFVKNYRSKTYAALRGMGVPVRFAVTGTPLENGLMDLWSLLSITSPGLLPDPQVFSETYRRPIEEGTDPQRRERLVSRIGPLLLRRTKEHVAAELPPKQEQVVRIDLAPAHRRAYDVRLARERRRVLKLATDMKRNRVAIFSSLTMLRQLALAPGLVDDELAHVESTKIEVLIDLLREVVEGGHRALVFSQFTRYLGMVRERLESEGIGTAYLDGTTRDRQGVIQSFREGEAPVFCISLKAGGFGLTLTEADYVFLLDPWWNPAAEQQAVDRTHRIGQTRQVMVYRLVAAGTIEDKVIALQERKRDLADQILGDGSALGGAMTADDLRELLG